MFHLELFCFLYSCKHVIFLHMLQICKNIARKNKLQNWFFVFAFNFYVLSTRSVSYCEI